MSSSPVADDDNGGNDSSSDFDMDFGLDSSIALLSYDVVTGHIVPGMHLYIDN